MHYHYIAPVMLLTLATVSAHGTYGAQALAQSPDTCPNLTLQESTEDCPWASLTRNWNKNGAVALPLSIQKQLERDRLAERVQSLWGSSLNWDENSKAEIVSEAILNQIEKEFLVPGLKPHGPHLRHAGMIHTYGYLFSNLLTPFGYKRARWVKGEIEKGLGLQHGLLGPVPPAGTLFQNVTELAAKISGHSAVQILNLNHLPWVPDLNLRGRLTERTETPEGTLEIFTDFYPFRANRSSENSHLLVYSIALSMRPGEQPGSLPKQWIITAFPVTKAFIQKVTDRSQLGNDQSIALRYNASFATFKKAKGSRTWSPPLVNAS